MSTLYKTTTATLNNAIIDACFDAGVTLPLLGMNDDADGADIANGFLLLDTKFRRTNQVTINGTVSRKVRAFGTFTVYICTPINSGTKQTLEIADVLHSAMSSQRFTAVFCYPGYIDSGHQIAYSKGNYWCVPFLVNFYIEEYI